MKQMMAFQENVEAIQSSRNEVLNSTHKSDGEREDGDGELIQLTKTTKAFCRLPFVNKD